MFRDSIPGLEDVFETDITPPKTILVTGPPGSMKTTFVHSLFYRYLEHSGEYAFYATLEEETNSLLESMTSIGIKPHMNLFITDFTEIREREEAQNIDYLAFLEKVISHYKDKFGDKFTLFALDSLGALYSLIPSKEKDEMRVRMYNFFRFLRKNNLISFIIMERSLGGESHLLGNEGFLADGIIFMGLDEYNGRLVRYIQVEKMRACKHSMEKFGIEVGEGGIQILRPIFEI